MAANVYNRAFSNSYTFGDGKELIATDHPNTTGLAAVVLVGHAPPPLDTRPKGFGEIAGSDH